MYRTNAKITSTKLGREDHGILTIWLMLSMDGSGIGYGGYALDQWSKPDNRRVGTAYGTEAIIGILKTLGCNNWEDVKGQLIRLEMTSEFGTVERIGHIIEDRWFSFKELADTMLKGE